METTLRWFTENPEQLIGFAMRRCYTAWRMEDILPTLTPEYSSYLTKSAYPRKEFDVYEHPRALFEVDADPSEILKLKLTHQYVEISPTNRDKHFVVSMNLRTLTEMARMVNCDGEECAVFARYLEKISPSIADCVLTNRKDLPTFSGERIKPENPEMASNQRVILLRSMTTADVNDSLSYDLPFSEAIRHSHYTAEIEGISRSCTHQLVRHRPFIFSQESQRFSDSPNEEFIFPENIDADPVVAAEVDRYVQDGRELYQWLRGKRITKEDARFVTHTGQGTKILATTSARQLMHTAFFRSDFSDIGPKAQWEIRSIISNWYEQAKRLDLLLPERIEEINL